MDGPLLPPGFRSVEWARRVQGLMQPRVCDRSFPVTEANCELTELMFCLNGKFGDGTRAHAVACGGDELSETGRVGLRVFKNVLTFFFQEDLRLFISCVKRTDDLLFWLTSSSML